MQPCTVKLNNEGKEMAHSLLNQVLWTQLNLCFFSYDTSTSETYKEEYIFRIPDQYHTSDSVLYMALSTCSEVETLDPSQVPLWVSETTVILYFQVATVTVLVYHANELQPIAKKSLKLELTKTKLQC